MKMKLYKFRPLGNSHDYDRVLSIIKDGFYCCDFLDLNDPNEGVFPVAKNISGVDLNQKIKYRICSFSEKSALESQLMWGHYANAGMGVAVEIEVSDSINFKKVRYGCSADNQYGNIEKILTNKSSDWKYEKEVRYMSTECKEHCQYDIEKIYFGKPYAHLGNYDELKKKHRKLSSYLKYFELLEAECEIRKIPLCGYEIPGV